MQGLRGTTIISIHAPAQGATNFERQQAYNKLISIHAPAQGATGGRVGTGSESGISIHAPAQGATVSTPCPPPAFRYFNSRSRTGSDIKDIGFSPYVPDFNSRSRTGSDLTH